MASSWNYFGFEGRSLALIVPVPGQDLMAGFLF